MPYQPEFCLKADQEPLETAERLLAADPRVAALRRDRAVLWLRGPLHDVLRVRPKRLQDTWSIARDLRKATHTKGFLFFDVDHSQESRWMHGQGLWSMCRLAVDDGDVATPLRAADDEDRWSVEYPDPDLRTARLAVRATQRGHERSFDDPLEAVRLGDEEFHCVVPGDAGAERDTLRAVGRRLDELDPDVLVTHGGDRFDIPFLLRRIEALGLRDRVRLGRDPDPPADRPDQAPKSIHTYGRWLYKDHAYYLRGRWHIDLAHKMLDSEEDRADLHGILYLARVSNRRAQDVARNGAGFALQQMQIDHATDLGVALPWKRNLTEDWKDAATLYAVDRGSQIMVPTPGIYEDVVACDFTGYYPSLVVRHNLSSDTLNCSCCPDGPLVPELNYHVCTRHKTHGEYGHQAEILRRLEPHRKWAKAQIKLAKKGLPHDAETVRRARTVKSEHKALGVVCFGYFRYRNARFGCAEVHQAIQCLGRDSMSKARDVAQKMGYRMVHELTDCAFLEKKGVTRAEALDVARRITRAVGVPMDVEGIYRWLVLLPSKTHSTTSAVGVPNRYYGKFADGSLKVRGIEVQRHSTPPFLHDVQEHMLAELGKADDAAGFRARIPYALRVAKQAAAQLIAHDVQAAELGLKVQATRAVEEYAANTGAKAALLQLRDAGTERRPGEYVQYVITRTQGPWAGRTRPVALLGEGSPWFDGGRITYHVEAYLRLLARQCETLLASFGYTEENMFGWLVGRRRTPL